MAIEPSSPEREFIFAFKRLTVLQTLALALSMMFGTARNIRHTSLLVLFVFLLPPAAGALVARSRIIDLDPWEIFLAAIGLVFVGVASIIAALTVFGRLLEGRRPADVKLHLTADGLYIDHSGRHSNFVSWTQVSQVIEQWGFMHYYRDEKLLYAVPKQWLRDAREIESLRQFLFHRKELVGRLHVRRPE